MAEFRITVSNFAGEVLFWHRRYSAIVGKTTGHISKHGDGGLFWVFVGDWWQ